MPDPTEIKDRGNPGRFARMLRLLRPSHEHSAFSATLLLMAAVMVAKLVGFLRETYIAWAFGAGHVTDAYYAAFQVPDFLNYLVAGGTVSITFVTIYSRLLSEKREAEAERTLSVIVTVMSTVLGVGILLGEIFTPQIERLVFPKFTPQELALCVHLTRILLPAQLFFYVGMLVSGVLQARRMFLIPAFAPILYTAASILGGVLGSRTFGIESLAIGAVAGALLGPFLLNMIGATSSGVRFRPSFDIHDAAFVEWVKLSVPLMLGVSLATADDWILRYFASSGNGDITRLNYAKQLAKVPIAVLGQATGQASLPFFARLWGEKKVREFDENVNLSIYRLVALALFATAWIAATALPFVDLAIRRGRFTFAMSLETAPLVTIFGLSLAFWCAQQLYSRAYYAIGNTLTPMIATTLITVASLPMYAFLFRAYAVQGLTLASDLGIAANTIVLALLLHYRGVVRLGGLHWGDLTKVVVSAIAAGMAGVYAAKLFPLRGNHMADIEALAVATAAWAAVGLAGLWITRSELLSQLRRRRGAPAATQPRITPETDKITPQLEP